MLVVDPLLHGDGAEKSEGEADVMVAVHDAVPHVPVGVGPPVVGVAVPDPVLDHVVLAAPAWDVGVELAEVNRHAKTKCFICSNHTDKLHVRLKYWQSKSAVKYLHTTCCDRIPAARSLHSRACLRFQRLYVLGGHADSVKVGEAIDASLLLLPP